MLARRRLFPLVLLAAPLSAQAREEDPQRHEVAATADITVENGGNAASLDLRYVFTPVPLDRNDEVVPILRRFVRHPTALWLGLKRNGSTFDSQTGAYAGGILEVLGGAFYASGQIGYESDSVEYDRNEDGYTAAPYHLEVGGRPAALISIGATYDGRPILGHTNDPAIFLPAFRDGGESKIGGLISFSTPNDRFFLKLSAGWYNADWTFTGFHPGGTTVEGPVIGLHLDYQMSAVFSLGFTADFSREHWVDTRLGDDMITWVGPDLDRIVYRAEGALEVVYWFKGRHGFRFSLGGGYADAAPLVSDRRRGLSKFGFGFVTRF